MRSFLSSLCLWLITLSAAMMGWSQSSNQPNIVFILADDMGYGEVSTYPANSPHGRIATPRLVKLASEGMTFTTAYAGEAVCAPSRCSLMTGKHTGHTTIRGNLNDGTDMPLSPSDVAIAQVLKNSGYDTAAFGKWGLGANGSSGSPWAKGFDTFYGQLGQAECHNYYPTFVWSYNASTGPMSVQIPQNRMASQARCMAPNNTCVYVPEEFASRAVQWIQQKRDKPFFLYLSLTPPHAGGWQGTLESGAPVPNERSYKNQPWPEVERDHAAMITYHVDAYVGKVEAALKEMGVENNTLVVFASDNGPTNEGGAHKYTFFASAGPLRGFKRSLYEGGIRIPMIIKWPGKIKSNSITNQPVAFWDFLPTFAKIANAPPVGGIDGVDISAVLSGGSIPDRPLYWEFCTNKAWGHAIRLGDWKAVSFAEGAPMQLYNVTSDISETNDLSSHHPQIVRSLSALAQKMHTDDPMWPIKNCISS